MVQLPGPANGLSIGLLGGSFNPAHAGHMHVAETAMRLLNLDWIWWLTARGNPLKSNHGDFTLRHRTAAAIANPNPRMRVSDLEIQMGLTYSVDTIAILKLAAPSARFVWLMGGDSLASFHHWKNWQSIAQMVPMAVIARPGSERSALSSPFVERFAGRRVRAHAAKALPFAPAPAWTYLPAPHNSLSSTELRNA